jgi:putative ABC transport system ATP-binding protein
METIVSVTKATKDYQLGKVVVQALRGVDLDVAAGEFLSIAGSSGSGKTTLLNLIGCVDAPTTGKVLVAGKDIGALSERELTEVRLHTIGFIFQSFNLVNVLDVFRNVELPLLLQRKLDAKQRAARVLELIARVGLSDFTRHRPGELSGGQRQRVAIARALVTQPKLVLADEPTANLDSATGQSILDLMRDMNRSQQTTFVFSTHDPKVMSYASRVIRLADGVLDSRRETEGPMAFQTERPASKGLA